MTFDWNRINNAKAEREKRLLEKHPIVVMHGNVIEVAKEQRVHAIVNAANGLGVMGAGVAKAIKYAAGQRTEDEAKGYIRSTYPHPPGDIYLSDGGNLREYDIRWIIHCVTMRHWDDPPKGLGGTVEDCGNALEKAFKQVESSFTGDLSIAVPALGTGRGGLPKMAIATEMVSRALNFPCIRIFFVDKDEEMVRCWKRALLYSDF